MAALLGELSQHARSYLGARLTAMLDAAPVALRELEERAATADERRLCGDARAALRAARLDLQRRYDAELDTLYSAVPAGPSAPSPPPSFTLSLQSDEQLAEMILVSDMVARADERCGAPLMELDRRMERAVERGLRLSHGALLPFAICQSFRRACELIDTLAPVRATVYRLFERYVVAELPAFYDALNELLERAGFIPAGAKPRPPRAKVASAPDAGAGAQAAAPAPAAAPQHPDVAAAMQQMQRLFGSLASTPAAIGHSPAGRESAASARAPGAAAGGLSDSALGAQIMQQLEQSAKEVTGGLVGAVSGLAQRMKLAGGMFDTLATDHDVPAELRAAVEALRFPVIKVALSDEQFLRSPQHPLRQLLDQIHQMALTAPIVGEETSTQVAQLIKAVRQQVDVPADRVAPALGTSVPIDVSEVEGIQQAQARIVQNHRQGTAQRVRVIVDQELSLRMADSQLPENLATPLVHSFGPMMCIQLSRHGRDSSRWQGAIAQLEQFLAALRSATYEPQTLPALGEHLVASEPEFLQAGMPQGQLQALRRAIHDATSRGIKRRPVTIEGEVVAATPMPAEFDFTIPLGSARRGPRAAPADYETTIRVGQPPPPEAPAPAVLPPEVISTLVPPAPAPAAEARIDMAANATAAPAAATVQAPAENFDRTIPVRKARITTITKGRKASTLSRPGPPVAFQHGESLRTLLVTGTWFRVFSPADQSTHWLKVSAYYVKQDVAAFATFDGVVALSVPGKRLVQDLAARRTEPVSPEPPVQGALDELVYQVRLRNAPG